MDATSLRNVEVIEAGSRISCSFYLSEVNPSRTGILGKFRNTVKFQLLHDVLAMDSQPFYADLEFSGNFFGGFCHQQ